MKETLSKEMIRQLEKQLASEVGELLKCNESDNLRWKGTQSDLIEALYVAFTTFSLHDDEGQGLSFIHIVRSVCNIVHMPIPRNPYELASRSRRRKGVRRLTYMERYAYKMMMQPDERPLWRQIDNIQE